MVTQLAMPIDHGLCDGIEMDRLGFRQSFGTGRCGHHQQSLQCMTVQPTGQGVRQTRVVIVIARGLMTVSSRTCSEVKHQSGKHVKSWNSGDVGCTGTTCQISARRGVLSSPPVCLSICLSVYRGAKALDWQKKFSLWGALL